MSCARIKRNDTVIAVAGVDAGKSGKVLEVLPVRDRAIVEGLNLVKKTMRKTNDNPQGGIAEKESPIAASNLMLYCPSCKKGVRISRVASGDGRVRKCRTCSHTFDS